MLFFHSCGLLLSIFCDSSSILVFSTIDLFLHYCIFFLGIN